jgi:hypothetical protein
MNPKIQIGLGLGLAAINVYDMTQVGFEVKHAVFFGLAVLAIVSGAAKLKS